SSAASSPCRSMRHERRPYSAPLIDAGRADGSFGPMPDDAAPLQIGPALSEAGEAGAGGLEPVLDVRATRNARASSRLDRVCGLGGAPLFGRGDGRTQRARQQNRHRGSAAGLAFDAHTAPALAREAVDLAQPETRALADLLRRKEGLVRAANDVRRHSGAVVEDAASDVVAG